GRMTNLVAVMPIFEQSMQLLDTDSIFQGTGTIKVLTRGFFCEQKVKKCTNSFTLFSKEAVVLRDNPINEKM
ncbi:MAG: hypothetical protein OEM43_06935, partial [Gammaproteobacteria bacterium]|nr:hypothetical protein [Gammaproteobacteria bacterium]